MPADPNNKEVQRQRHRRRVRILEKSRARGRTAFCRVDPSGPSSFANTKKQQDLHCYVGARHPQQVEIIYSDFGCTTLKKTACCDIRGKQNNAQVAAFHQRVLHLHSEVRALAQTTQARDSCTRCTTTPFRRRPTPTSIHRTHGFGPVPRAKCGKSCYIGRRRAGNGTHRRRSPLRGSRVNGVPPCLARRSETAYSPRSTGTPEPGTTLKWGSLTGSSASCGETSVR